MAMKFRHVDFIEFDVRTTRSLPRVDVVLSYVNADGVMIDAAANPEQKARLAKISPQQIHHTELAGEKIDNVLSRAPGNDAPIGIRRGPSSGGTLFRHRARDTGRDDRRRRGVARPLGADARVALYPNGR